MRAEHKQNDNRPSPEDQGWAQMKDLLDKEMPEKKKRRLLPLWLWGGAAVLCMAGILSMAFGWLSPLSPGEHPGNLPAKKRIQEVQAKVDPSLIRKEGSTEDQPLRSLAISPSLPVPGIDTIKVREVVPPTLRDVFSGEKQGPVPTPQTDITREAGYLPVLTCEVEYDQAFPLPSSGFIPEPGLNPSGIQSPWAGFVHLDLGGGQVRPLVNWAGLGVSARRNIRPNVGLEAGMGYRYFRATALKPWEVSDSLVSLAADLKEAEALVYENSAIEPVSRQYSVSVYLLEARLGGYYRFSEQLSLSGGITAGLALRRASDQGYQLENVLERSNFTYHQEQLGNESAIQPFIPGAYLDLSWAFSRNWAFSMGYRYSGRNLLPDRAFKEIRPAGIQFGIAYRFF